jgi:hypothetical protein
MDMKEGSTNLFGVSDTVQSFLDLGIPNALVSTIFVSLSWWVTMNTFPMLFLSNPLLIWIIWLCLAMEGMGFCDSARIFAKLHQMLVGYQPDKEYTGKMTMEDMADVVNLDLELGDSSITSLCQGGKDHLTDGEESDSSSRPTSDKRRQKSGCLKNTAHNKNNVLTDMCIRHQTRHIFK